MKGWLVVNEFLHSNKFNEIHSWLLEAAKKQEIDLHLKTNAELLIDLQGSREDKSCDFILFWDKDVRLARHLELQGYPVFNSSSAIYACDDKSMTHLLLMNAGIRMPRTIVAPMTFDNIGYTNYDFLSATAERLGFPLVVKECFGSFGKQVYLVRDYNELVETVGRIGTGPMLFQQYISSSFARDVRLQAVGGRVIASMYRYSDNGDFRANLTIGGKMKPYTPSMKQVELALRSCEVLGLDFAGVDLLFGENDEPLVCEVNSNAHFKNIYECTGVNAADAILAHIGRKISAV